MRLDLLAWLMIAGLAMAMAPPPPPSPLITADELSTLEASIERSLVAAARWEGRRGDREIPWDEAEGHLAIVIDDVGRELHLFEQLLGLRYRLSFAVLPGAVYAPGVQLRLRADRRRHREILLHLPMEPLDPAAMEPEVAAGEEFLRRGEPPAGLVAALDRALARVPAAVGVNNHMGSALSADRSAMDALMPRLRAEGLFVLDSLTVSGSELASAAEAAGVPALRRSVFLDHDPAPEAIEAQLRRAAELSRRQPTVAIGHPSAALVDVLRRELPRLDRAGIAIVPLSEIIGRSGAATPRE
ncbi:MAG: divergent polysaccharide deacetylase family protein [Myxococcales bacterium]|nr:divergent polysaccharide deacetylase family protein [Myxococcales bacterium]